MEIRKKKRHVLKRQGNLRIFWFFCLFLILCANCSENGGQTSPPEIPPPTDSYHVFILGIDTAPSSQVVPPIEGSVPGVAHPGIFLIFRDHDINLSVENITINGNELSVSVKIRNNLGVSFPRTWVIVHSPDNGVKLEPSKADGFIDEGVFYYLGGLDYSEEKSTTIYFTLPAELITQFSFLLDVGEVHDRLVFVSTQAAGAGRTTEIYSMNYNGSDLFRVTNHNGDVIPSLPRWSPNGGWIAYTGKRSGEPEQVWLARADGKGSVQLTCYENTTVAGDFTRNGKKIYVRHIDSVTPEANLYLLDISKELTDCSDTSALTPLTVDFPGSENVPILSKDGDKLVYIKREYSRPVTPPPPCDQICGNPPEPCFGNPPMPCCGDPPEPCCGSPPTPWTDKYVQNYNLYYLPVSPETGERIGNEVKYWEESLFTRGDITFSADCTKVVANAGGCAEWQGCCPGQTYCSAAGSPWGYKCNFSLSRAIYSLDFNTTLPNPPPYSYLSAPGSAMYRKFDNTDQYEYDPSWSVEYNLLAFSKLDLSTSYIQLWLLDPADPLNTKIPLTNFGYFNVSSRFMPWP